MQKNLPILIIGQGIAGTLLSFELWQKGIPFLVIDKPNPYCASRVSGAVLNPYSGRTLQGINRRSKMYDIAKEKYEQIGTVLKKSVLKPAPLLLFEENSVTPDFLKDKINDLFLNDDAISYFEAVALVDNNVLIASWSAWLRENNLLIENDFDEIDLHLDENVIYYKGAQFAKIIYCNGVEAMRCKYFTGLRFTENRGDVLCLEILGLPENFVYQKDKVRLLPKGNDIFWCGSNYLWQYDNMVPDETWKNETCHQLEQWLKIPFEVKAHLCAKRPTTAGQIPFIGWHPKHPQIGICNGLGTKGFSAGPLWIADFVQQSIVQNQSSMYQNVLDKCL